MRNGTASPEDGTLVRPSPRPSAVESRAAGLLVALLALGVGQLVAAFGTPAASPVVAIGQAAIDLSPQPVKSWAISTFGAADKDVLVAGVLAVVVVLALALGPAAMRSLAVGLAAVGTAAGVGVAAALTRSGASLGWAVPSLAAGLAGAIGLSVLAPRAGRPAAVGSPPERATALDRRAFLRAAIAVGGVALGSGAVGVSRSRNRASIEAARASLRLPPPADPARPVPPGAELAVEGVSPFLTPNDRFYRVDTALFVPEVDVRTWTLRIRGRVSRPVTFTFPDLLDRPLIERDVTLACVSNEVGGPYVGNARWIGVPLAPLLREAGVDPATDQLVSRSVDGFTAGTPMRLVLDGRDAMLALAMNGEPLPMEHGFPVRMVVPGLYGYESATKWLAELEATTYDSYDAYWVQRGWARIAPIKTQSRIDTPRGGSTRQAGRVVVAGVAWDQHTGIERVEVRVDDGPWTDAALAAQDSVDTWRQWRYDWDATPGSHAITVRATNADGVVQPSAPTPPFPDGAAGWHRIGLTID
jgi:DMSO/TMAO reductase YedYZ molybdopterin-dependent catalytic subunit